MKYRRAPIYILGLLFLVSIFFSELISEELKDTPTYATNYSVFDDPINNNLYKEYGPIRIFLSNSFRKDNISLIKGINLRNQYFYLAIACNKRLINVTGTDLTWKNWSYPKEDFENQIINDVCF